MRFLLSWNESSSIHFRLPCMNISFAKNLASHSTPVFLLKEAEKIQPHSLYSRISPDEQTQLKTFEKQSPSDGEHTHVVFLPTGRKALILNVGKDFSHRKAVLTMRKIIHVARREKIKSLTLHFENFFTDFSHTSARKEALAEIMATQLELANFEFVKYKKEPKEGWFFVDEAVIYSDNSGLKNLTMTAAIHRGKIIGEEINHCRILSNTPGGEMTPKKLAESAEKAAKRCGFQITILDEQEIKKLGMGGILGVSSGSEEKPRFIILKHLKGKKDEKPIVLVGKGVTFDTGGLNLKPGDSMSEMHMDMSGGAAVIHTLSVLARLNTKKNIIGLVPAVENMPSGSSYHPGDILKTMSGKTIEVLNTDAEGRIILADALTYAKRYAPRLIVDIATLTGAAVVALGQRASALFSTDEELAHKIQKIGEGVCDFVWPLPLWEEYEEEIQGTFGDIANIGKTRYGGAITGAVFLWQFVKDTSDSHMNTPQWVHIDIAPRMTTIDGEYLAKGAAGAPVALLATFLRQ